MRAKAREVAFQIVFASRFGEAEKGLKTAMYKNLNKDDVEYCERGFVARRRARNRLYANFGRTFPSFSRVATFPADKSILLIALAEILHMDDIPFAVSLNEAANIASKYSSEKSASFISGILSGVKKV